MALCPECGQKLQIPDGLERWDHVQCQACGAELEVLRTRPLELEAVFDFEEDDDLSDLEELDEDDLVDDEDWEEDDEDEDDDDDDDDEDDDDDW
jgi:lysine biosynthesis protein LysW